MRMPHSACSLSEGKKTARSLSKPILKQHLKNLNSMNNTISQTMSNGIITSVKYQILR